MTLIHIIALVTLVAARQPTYAHWLIEYDRTRQAGHNPPALVREKADLSVRSVGDSLFGSLRLMPAPGTTDTLTWAVRGVSRRDGLSLRVDSRRAGAGGWSATLGAAMDYLREALHGVAPTTVAFELTVTGDSLQGSRTLVSLEGQPLAKPVAVTGTRVRQP